MQDQLAMAELHQKWLKLGKDELVLDVRSKDEFEEGHVPKSRNIPYDEVKNHVEELRKFSKIYVYCRVGGRAQMACQILEKEGLKNLVCVVNSGMPEWQRAGYQVDK